MGLIALVPAMCAAPAWAAAPPVAYVADSSSGLVTPIDTATNTAGTPIAVGGNPFAIAITPDDRTAYVTNVGSNSVTPIDTATNTAGTPIAVGVFPQTVAITPDGRTAYVADSGSNLVTPIDIATNTAGTPITVGTGPVRIAITPDGRTAYVVNAGSSSVTPIDTATNTAGTPIAVGGNPVAIAITPDGKTAYVTNYVSDLVTPIDTATNTAGTPIAVGGNPVAIAITPDGKTAYAVNFTSDTVTPIDIATNTAGTPITVGTHPEGVAVTPDGRTAYVGNSGSSSVTPIDTATNTAGTPIAVGASPIGIAITPDQGPVAAFSAAPAPAGEVTSFDASGSVDPDGGVASYRWDFGDGATETTDGPTTAHRYATPGTHTVTLTVIDDAACSAVPLFTGQTMSCNGGPRARATRDLTIAPSSSPPAPQSAVPVLQGLRVSPASFSSAGQRVGGRCVKATRHDARRPACTRTAKLTIGYTLSTAATVELKVTGRLPGHKVKGRCVARTPGNHQRRCTRPLKPGISIVRQGQAGADRFVLTRKLAPGTYTLTATPTGGAAKHVTFRILG